MAKYGTNNQLGGTQQNLSSSYKTILSVYGGSTARRGEIVGINIGANGTPADNELEWDASQVTADAGTGTSVTPVKFDQADAASSMTSKANYTGEPTPTSNSSAFYTSLNQRATFRWAVNPGDGIVWPATTTAGYILRAKSAAYTSTVTGALEYIER